MAQEVNPRLLPNRIKRRQTFILQKISFTVVYTTLVKQGRKAAVTMRSVTQAHFVSLEGSNVLSLKLENGKHRNKPSPKTASRDQNDL